MTSINNKHEFITAIKQKMYNVKIESLKEDFIITSLYESDFYVLIHKLLTTIDDVYIYSKAFAGSVASLSVMPHYNIKTQSLRNISLSTSEKQYYVLPILLTTKNPSMKHIIIIIVNHLQKQIIYFDSYGTSNNPDELNQVITKNEAIILMNIIKEELFKSGIINKKYTIKIVNMPLQIKIADDISDWYYDNTCIILSCYFIMVYLSNKNINKTAKVFDAMLNEKELFRQMIKYTYVSIKI